MSGNGGLRYFHAHVQPDTNANRHANANVHSYPEPYRHVHANPGGQRLLPNPVGFATLLWGACRGRVPPWGYSGLRCPLRRGSLHHHDPDHHTHTDDYANAHQYPNRFSDLGSQLHGAGTERPG